MHWPRSGSTLLFGAFLGGALGPVVAELVARKDLEALRSRIRATTTFGLTLGLPVAVILFLGSQAILGVIGEDYVAGAPQVGEFAGFATQSNPDASNLTDAIDAALTAGARVVLLCNPNNPTGAVYPVEQIKKVLH